MEKGSGPRSSLRGQDRPVFNRTNFGTVSRLKLQSVWANRLVGLVVKASDSGAQDPEFESRLRRDFSGSCHTSDLKIGTPVATLPGAWRYIRASAGPGVSIL